MQALLGGYTREANDAFSPVFLPPAKPLQLADVMSALRLRYNGTKHDPYTNQTPAPLLDGTPGEPWRPVAFLATGLAHGATRWAEWQRCWGKQCVSFFQLVNRRPLSHTCPARPPAVTRMRPPSDALPPGLSTVHYMSFGTPAWTPFIPIYRGLPPTALPPALTSVEHGTVNTSTLFWKSRRLSALLFEDWPRLGPGTEAEVAAFDARIEAKERPAMEERYTAAVAAGDEAAAGAELAAFTADVVAQVFFFSRRAAPASLLICMHALCIAVLSVPRCLPCPRLLPLP